MELRRYIFKVQEAYSDKEYIGSILAYSKDRAYKLIRLEAEHKGYEFPIIEIL